MIILGIDPGKSGAIVVRHGSDVLYQRRADTADGYHIHGSRQPASENVMLQALLTMREEVGRWPDRVVLEAPSWHASSGGRMSAGVAGRLGVEHGCWRMALACYGLSYEVLDAKVWRKRAGISTPKGGDVKAAVVAVVSSRLRGLDLYPGTRKKPHDGLADAAGMTLAVSDA